MDEVEDEDSDVGVGAEGAPEEEVVEVQTNTISRAFAVSAGIGEAHAWWGQQAQVVPWWVPAVAKMSQIALSIRTSVLTRIAAMSLEERLALRTLFGLFNDADWKRHVESIGLPIITTIRCSCGALFTKPNEYRLHREACSMP